ncbi:hypothetical protein [Corynebacterium sphenisci]|uniref:hypothetical protein n=1 Tax=Corynebacterium sphenisci TaxID=191493 RepID=UPI0026DF1278|nr:hypothetical protein [Corynebacterium sphenisci]MDO5731875.1 hypothetical protein [Corynebacterium sphenisci]
MREPEHGPDRGERPRPGRVTRLWAVLITLVTLLGCVVMLRDALAAGLLPP